MPYVDKRAFARYLRMGRDWPQLRCPLAIAILACPSRRSDPYGFLSERHLSEEQALRTALAAENLHRHFGISVRSLTPEMAQLEWHRALGAATYILFNVLEEHPHRQYDPYYNYVKEADRRNLRKILHQHTEIGLTEAFLAFGALYEILIGAKGLAGLFRTSYTLNKPEESLICTGRHVCPQEYRHLIVKKLRKKMLPLISGIPARAASAAAMGIDWKLLERSVPDPL